MDRLKELLLRVLELAYKISNETIADVFFRYSPHVNSFDLEYHKAGWAKSECICIASTQSITEENLENAIEELKRLCREVL